MINICELCRKKDRCAIRKILMDSVGGILKVFNEAYGLEAEIDIVDCREFEPRSKGAMLEKESQDIERDVQMALKIFEGLTAIVGGMGLVLASLPDEKLLELKRKITKELLEEEKEEEK